MAGPLALKIVGDGAPGWASSSPAPRAGSQGGVDPGRGCCWVPCWNIRTRGLRWPLGRTNKAVGFSAGNDQAGHDWVTLAPRGPEDLHGARRASDCGHIHRPQSGNHVHRFLRRHLRRRGHKDHQDPNPGAAGRTPSPGGPRRAFGAIASTACSSSDDVISTPCSASTSSTTTSTVRNNPSSCAHRLRRAALLPSSVTSSPGYDQPTLRADSSTSSSPPLELGGPILGTDTSLSG